MKEADFQKDGICGDDLEKLPTENKLAGLNRDCLRDPSKVPSWSLGRKEEFETGSYVKVYSGLHETGVRNLWTSKFEQVHMLNSGLVISGPIISNSSFSIAHCIRSRDNF